MDGERKPISPRRIAWFTGKTDYFIFGCNDIPGNESEFSTGTSAERRTGGTFLALWQFPPTPSYCSSECTMRFVNACPPITFHEAPLDP
jgi:hypothetical protein